MSRVVVDNKVCTVCCECINICREEVLGLVGGKTKVIKPSLCTFCEDCADICEFEAIEVIYD